MRFPQWLVQTAVGGLVAAMLSWGVWTTKVSAQHETRIAVNETQMDDISRQLEKIDSKIDRMDNKIDKLIEEKQRYVGKPIYGR